MPEVIFCDVDETLISMKSMVSFLDFALEARGLSPEAQAAVRRPLADRTRPRRELNSVYYEIFADWDVAETHAMGEAWFEGLTAEGLWVRPVVTEIRPQQLTGARLVLVSGSFDVCLAPIAEACSAHDVLGTSLVERDGRFTGEISRTMLGADKARAVLQWCAEHGVDPARCRAYGDDPSDGPMLDAVGEGVAVVRTPQMRELANERGWRVLDPGEARVTPRPMPR